jgi:hypothetical protein
MNEAILHALCTKGAADRMHNVVFNSKRVYGGGKYVVEKIRISSGGIQGAFPTENMYS